MQRCTEVDLRPGSAVGHTLKGPAFVSNNVVINPMPVVLLPAAKDKQANAWFNISLDSPSPVKPKPDVLEPEPPIMDE
eukprot:scaffold229791_cov15-Tisochrysis_lutea.AAC.1